AIEQEPRMLLEAFAGLRRVAQYGDGARDRPPGRRHAMQGARALEQHERTLALLQLAHIARLAVQNPRERGVTLRGVAPAIRHIFEGPAFLGIAQEQSDGEGRIVEMPAQLLPFAIEAYINGRQRVLEGKEAFHLE